MQVLDRNAIACLERCFDNNSADLKKLFLSSVPVEAAASYSLLQAVAEPVNDYWLWESKPHFNSQSLREWWLKFEFKVSEKLFEKVLEESPAAIAIAIETYYKKVASEISSPLSSNSRNSLERLYVDFSRKFFYCEVFSLAGFGRAYGELLQTERERRIAILVCGLEKYRDRFNEWPEDIGVLGEQGYIIEDPVTGESFSYEAGKDKVRVEAPESFEYESISVMLNRQEK